MENEHLALREVARIALNSLPDAARAQVLGELLAEDDGPRALDRLSRLRAIISLRMQELIDGKFPLHALAEIYAGPAVVQARFGAAQPSRMGFFDPEGAKDLAASGRRRNVEDRTNSLEQVVDTNGSFRGGAVDGGGHFPAGDADHDMGISGPIVLGAGDV